METSVIGSASECLLDIFDQTSSMLFLSDTSTQISMITVHLTPKHPRPTVVTETILQFLH